MVLQAVGGLAIIAALLALNALALYAIWWIVMIVVSYVADDWQEASACAVGPVEQGSPAAAPSLAPG